MMSERGLTAGICHRINNRGFHSLLAVLPFHHLSGFSSVLNALYLGAEVCIATDIKYFYRYLEAMKPGLCICSAFHAPYARKKIEKTEAPMEEIWAGISI